MTPEILLLIFVGVTGLALVVQALSVWQYSRSVKEIVHRLERRSDQIEQDIQQVVQQFSKLSEDLQPLGRIVQSTENTFDELNKRVQERSRDVDSLVAEVLQVGRNQAAKIDFVVTDTVQKFQQTTDVIQRDILRPAVEVSSVVKGIKSGVEFLLNRKPARPDASQASSDEEELFI